ncbi:MAG: hypothetical protein HY785_23115 [Oscillatoriophycideae cyanobacterium NC_groundwater_1537_Pr4_S-0.65um_50_18]|nr:hypothetical protein [Oscillatoriophycideae cyanobacterium NC_groundwater_1537_Pr4_S-0.65um_50_18]
MPSYVLMLTQIKHNCKQAIKLQICLDRTVVKTVILNPENRILDFQPKNSKPLQVRLTAGDGRLGLFQGETLVARGEMIAPNESSGEYKFIPTATGDSKWKITAKYVVKAAA